MEVREWDEKEVTERETPEHEMAISAMESRLRGAVSRIVPDESARKRIIAGAAAGRRGRRRLAPRIPAAVFAACMLFSLLLFANPGMIGDDVVVYAATEEHGWQKLKEGERIQLKREPYEEAWTDEDFDETGRCTYYPYKCTFRVELPEHYVYDRQMVMIRDDDILVFGDKLEWWVAPERQEDAGKVMQGAFRLWIVDENLERQAALELELTKEDGKCYAELKRVWESEAYNKNRHKK
jgi:hypothetical protein